MNYFKSPSGQIFLFDEKNDDSTIDAWAKAVTSSGNSLPSIYQPMPIAGPWDRAPVIGHRPRAAILNDLVRAIPEEKPLFEAELESLDDRFDDIGRCPPLVGVAA